ncbi:MAG: HAMP domain-containing sensor histidine kinase [Acidimicrobiales bacterium]
MTPTVAADTSRFRPLGQLGLRARITSTFTMGATVIAVLLSVTSVALSRSNLLEQRERLVQERTLVNVTTLADKLTSPDIDAQTLFGSLSTAGKPSALVPTVSGDTSAGTGELRSISLDARYGVSALPRLLRDRVINDHRAGIMRYERNGEALLAVGVPIAGGRGGYFEINQIDDISRAIDSLGYRLVGACVVAALFGGVLGFWASRRVLRPLADVSQVAEAISLGKFDARLVDTDWAHDPDLGQLVSSFNAMVSSMQTRIDRDAQFASDVSHELRSPLTTFNASLEVLRNARDEMPDRAQIALDLLSSDMERFTQLVEDLLEISRFDAGAVRLELDEVLLVETIRMAVRSLSRDPLPVEAEPGLDDLIIMCDKRRLMRILANFIDNAKKYANGATNITVARVHAPEPDPTAASDDAVEDRLDTVEIAVEDAGPGVPEAERARIFDRFNRGGQGGSRGTDLGVGLGLALAAEHARLHGGSVWVEGRADGAPGARFVLSLPLIEPVDDPTEPSLDEAEALA